MWFKDILLALFFRLPDEVVGELAGEKIEEFESKHHLSVRDVVLLDKVLSSHLMDCHPQHIGQAVGLALAHVPREQRVVALQELQEGGGGGDVALDSGTFHLELHLQGIFW